MPELWAGTDAGKAAHHCTVIDTDGTKVLSRRVPNNEPELLELIGDVLALAEDSPVTWAVDLNAGGGALLIGLLTSHRQRLLYIPGRTVHHASRGYRGDGKTDAKDAYVIADQARMRRDLQPLQEWDEIAVDLKILTARRYDLAADRTRADRKRAEGKSHKQAILALARRRLDVLWALIRDQRQWTAQPPQPGLADAA